MTSKWVSLRTVALAAVVSGAFTGAALVCRAKMSARHVPKQTPTNDDIRTFLANILPQAKEFSTRYKNAHSASSYKPFYQFADGSVYFTADMDIDTDGSPRAKQIDPCCGQLQTSLSCAYGWKGKGYYVNSEEIPYFVLPLDFEKKYHMGVNLGDLALVMRGDQREFAIYADAGPTTLIGEGSVFLAKALGYNPFNANGKVTAGIPDGVEYLVFPGSAEENIPATVEEIQQRGTDALRAFLKVGR